MFFYEEKVFFDFMVVMGNIIDVFILLKFVLFIVYFGIVMEIYVIGYGILKGSWDILFVKFFVF